MTKKLALMFETSIVDYGRNSWETYPHPGQQWGVTGLFSGFAHAADP